MPDNFKKTAQAQPQNLSENSPEIQQFTIINVAVAVIHYQQQYLLGFRNSAQHQGDRYEFVGGKIESDETAIAALRREVAEETGIDIKDNFAIKLGRLHHDYGDKQVCLQVYKIELSAGQFEQHQHCRYGLEGQALTWVHKQALLAGNYALPAANQTILTWLQLPPQIAITYPLAQFAARKNGIGQKEACEAWLTYHRQHIPQAAWVYVRIKAQAATALDDLKHREQLSDLKPDNTKETGNTTDIALAEQLLTLRPDIKAVLPYDSSKPVMAIKHSYRVQIKAAHLTHTELMNWFNDSRSNLPNKEPDKPLLISCHDEASIRAANALASIRLQQQKAPVIGMFLSPVLATQTHPNEVALGWQVWSSLAELADMPVIALGGLSPSLSQKAACHGALGVAGIRQFLAEL